MKKIFAAILAVLMLSAVFCGCNSGKQPSGEPPQTDNEQNDNEQNEPEEQPTYTLETALSAGGYVKGKISDFSQYENTDAYRKVTTAEELLQAIADAKYHYQNVWDEETKTYSQLPADGFNEQNFKGTVHVIEIENDLNLGYYKLSKEAKDSGLVTDYGANVPKWTEYLSMSDMVLENGISQIKIENTSDLLIYSKTGAKLTHCGFKLTSDNNVVFRNLQFDELWQWEDAPVNTTDKIGDYDWFGWAYFKISFCGYIWIDHCTFGKSYDGQIDYSNPVYNANGGTAFRAPYGADGNNGLHISYCRFNAGSDDEDGYLYKMMEKIESEYQAGGQNYLYYNALRNAGAGFEDILYGIAVPQKKGFLCGDDATFSGSYDNADDYNFNLRLQVSFANCVFKNLEDRLPKLRGGNAYMYNCLVDSSQYYGYRAKLSAINAKNVVASVKSSWKCGLVSQGIVCGNGGSVKAENCIFKGIEYLLKNNDTKNSGVYVNGGYCLVNCSYQKGENSAAFVGSSADAGNNFSNDTPSKLKTEYFEWHTADKTQPFEVAAVALDGLEAELENAGYGAGTKAAFAYSLLKADYNS